MSTIKNSYEYYEGNQSLLNMLNKKKQGNPLINQIILNNQNNYQKKMETMGFLKNTSNDKYSKVNKATDSLLDAVDEISNDSLYRQEEGKEYDKTALVKAVSYYIAAYNNQIYNLASCGGALNSEFSEEYQNLTKENKNSLEEIGITAQKDGKLAINQDKLNNSSVDAIKKLFNNSDYIKSVKQIASNINDILSKARAMKSANYNSKGLFN